MKFNKVICLFIAFSICVTSAVSFNCKENLVDVQFNSQQNYAGWDEDDYDYEPNEYPVDPNYEPNLPLDDPNYEPNLPQYDPNITDDMNEYYITMEEADVMYDANEMEESIVPDESNWPQRWRIDPNENDPNTIQYDPNDEPNLPSYDPNVIKDPNTWW
jgi:hypothetical protein